MSLTIRVIFKIFFFFQSERSKILRSEVEAVDDEEDDDEEEGADSVASSDVAGKNVNINKTADPETEKKVSLSNFCVRKLNY